MFYWAALQHAGRNPSQKTIDKYWTPQTAKLNFDDFCIILRKEKPTSKAELLKSFKQLDINDDGSILHSDLYKLLTKVRSMKQFCNMHNLQKLGIYFWQPKSTLKITISLAGEMDHIYDV